MIGAKRTQRGRIASRTGYSRAVGDSFPIPDSPSPGRCRPPRGIGRWLLRFLLRASAIVAGTLLLFGLIGALLYANRVHLLNQTLALLVEPFRVSVEDLDFYPIGVIRLTGLELSPKAAPPDSRLATIPEVVVTYRLEELRRTGRLGNITLRRPLLTLDDALLDALAGRPAATAGKSSTTPDAPPALLSRLALFTGDLSVEEGRFRVALSSGPLLEGTWSFRTAAIDFEEASGLIRAPFAWDFRDLVLGENGSGGRIAAVSGEGRVSADLSRIELDPVRLDRPELTISPSLFPVTATRAAGSVATTVPSPDVASPTRQRNSPELTIRGLSLREASVTLTGFDGRDGRARLPDLVLGASFTAPELHLREGRWDSAGPIHLPLAKVEAGSGGLPFLSASGIRAEASSLATLIEERRFESIVVDSLDVLGSDETLARFLGPAESKPDAAGEPGKPWTIGTFSLGEGRLLVRGLTLAGKPAAEFTSSVKATLRDLRFGGAEGFASDGKQSLVLSQTRLRSPGTAPASEPILSLEQVELEGSWSDFQRENVLDRLVVRGPAIQFTDAALGTWLDDRAAPSPGVPGPLDRPVYKVRNLSVTGGRLVADSRFAGGRVPKIQSGFVIETVPPRDGDPFSYRLRFDDLTLRNHPRVLEFVGPPAPSRPGRKQAAAAGPVAEDEVFLVKTIEVEATAAELQRTRHLGKVKIDGAVLTVGEGLRAIAGGGKPLPDPAQPVSAPAPQAGNRATTRDLPAWNLDEIEITRSRVHFEAIVPQIEGLQFAIETRLFDVPLSLDGLLAQDKLQKIELAGIEIKDPYTSFITVADLPTIFVEFSLAGLARQTVEKIDLIGPSLHVGQGLFWWVDYQRKFREQNEGASLGFESDEPPQESGKKNGWIIRTINATAGKIVIAPTGVPIGAVPFPFSATTNMSEGSIELKLNIPDEEHVYRFPQYKVEVSGLAGDVRFNVPVEDVNNNLVQTFTLKRAKWKDYEARDLFLSVTFDENGVYGKFGGAAYDGYTEGQFNFYLKDEGKWDAWIAGTGLDTGPITSVIAPGTFLMDGKVSLKLISEGRRKVVGKTSGEFRTTTPGWFDVTKLDTILETLPPEWNSLQRSLTELSLIALKRFDYDSGSGSLSFLNREGTLDLRFEGDDGTRALRLQAHDERNPNRSAAITTTKTGTPSPPAESSAPVPEASARPAGAARLAGARSPR